MWCLMTRKINRKKRPLFYLRIIYYFFNCFEINTSYIYSMYIYCAAHEYIYIYILVYMCMFFHSSTLTNGKKAF